VAAIRAAQLGLKVACVEQEQALGGTCLRIGCIPSKALLDSSQRFWEAKQKLREHGIGISGLTVEIPAMQKRKDEIVNTLTRGVDFLFKKHNIRRFGGHGRIEAPGRVKVEGDTLKGGHQTVEARSILLATGSKPALLPKVELDGERIGTSTEALSYAEVPQHLVVIGGGYIGLELGSVWKRLGANVTILEFLDQILYGMDGEIAAQAKKVFEKQGLEFCLGAKVTAARVAEGQCVVECEGSPPVT